MKERLIQLLDLEQLSPSKFADIIGVQRSSISHVISGRNKPSFDFLQKTLKAFPGLNASWLLLGEGTMYEQMGRTSTGNLFDTQESEKVLQEEHIQEPGETEAEIPSVKETVLDSPAEPSETEVPTREEPETASGSAAKKRIVQVMVIYEDDTFRTFSPAH